MKGGIKELKGHKLLFLRIFSLSPTDADSYERCLLRIGVFHNAIGGCEDILGRITEEIHNVAENLRLTGIERKEKLKQIADNDIRLLKEQADLEEKESELFGLRLPSQQKDTDIESVHSFWLSPKAAY